MANNYVIYDINGLLADSKLSQISKGNNKVDHFYISFNGYDYNNTYVTIATTLPDGNVLPELPTSISDFTFKNQEYRGYKFTVTSPLTEIAGVLTMTFYLRKKDDDSILCSSQENIKIYDSDVAVEPTIDQTQLEALLVAIDNTGKDLDAKKLNKDFSTYEGLNSTNGEETIVVQDGSGENKSVTLSSIHNIVEINGVKPVDRKVTLTASNINYNDKTIGAELDDLNQEVELKANSQEVVYYRNGALEDVADIIPTGILNHTAESYVDGYYFARITLNDTDFEDGDIVTCDVRLEVNKDNGTFASALSFTRVIEVGNIITHNLVIGDGTGGFDSVQIYGGIQANRMFFRIINTSNVIYKPTITYSVVRRG